MTTPAAAAAAEAASRMREIPRLVGILAALKPAGRVDVDSCLSAAY
jgi:hypothetical protein